MTKIILVRHGHVDGISPERFRGRADLALTPDGIRQAEATARRIERNDRVAAVYSSPLRRCLATAAAIGRPFGLTPIPLDGLNDIDYGEWQGSTPDEVGTRWPDELILWHRRPDWARIPAGETLQAVLTRAVAALRQVIRQHPAETVVLVGHDSVNRVILLHLLDLPLSRYWRLRQDPCAINEIDWEDASITIACVNRTDHLLSL